MHSPQRHHRSPGTLCLIMFLLSSLVMASACGTTKRIQKSGLYWETLDTRELKPQEVTTHWGNLHAERVEPLTTPGWAKASVKDDNVQVSFEDRCAGLVELPSQQMQDFQHVGGWHTPLFYGALLGAAVGFIVGGGAMALTGTGMDDELAQGHPAIPSYYSDQGYEAAMIGGMSAGGAMTLLAGTAFLLDVIVTSDVMDISSLYGLDGHPCDPDDEDSFALVPTVASAELVGVGPLKLGIRSLLIPSEGPGVEASAIEALFSAPSQIDLEVKVAADVPGAGDQRPVSQSITLEGDRDASVINALAQGLARRGVALNSSGDARLKVTSSGYSLTLDAHAALTPPAGMKAQELLERLASAAMNHGGAVIAKRALVGDNQRVVKGLDTVQNLSGTPQDGGVRFEQAVGLEDVTFSRALIDWRGADNAPTLVGSREEITWRISDKDREGAQRDLLGLYAKQIKRSKYKALSLGAASYEPAARIAEALPGPAMAREHLCQSPPSYLQNACQQFNNTWTSREKSLSAATSKQLQKAAKTEMRELNKYVAQQARAASKGGDLDIRTSSDPASVAENQCLALSDLQEVVCAKGTPLFNTSTCGIAKGCLKKLTPAIANIVSKLKRDEERRARAQKCADKKCPHIGYCSSNTEFNAWGNIKAYPRSCSYMIEPCMRVRGEMQALKCMQKRYNSCRRGCGLKD